MRLPDAKKFRCGAIAQSGCKFVIATLFIALAYVLTGKLALLLAFPPGYATAIFPPAGIAVGMAFISGRLALSGIFLGSLLLNVWIGRDPLTQLIDAETYMAAGLIAAASTLQAGVGGWLLRRRLGYPCAFDRPRDISEFLLLSPLICLISASVSVASLFMLGLFDSSNAIANWGMWWLGDTMGVLIALPIVMVAFAEPKSLWRRRKFVITVPLSMSVALFVFAFTQAMRWEELESLNYLRTQIGWQSWAVLTLGLFGTSLLGAYLLLSSGHTARVEQEVELHVHKLRESEERWQFALEGAGDGVWDIDLKTGEMYLSRQNMSMLGYENEARRMNAEEWKAWMRPDDLARAREITNRYLRGETTSYFFEFQILTRDGQWRWLRSRGKLFGIQPDGQPAHLIGTHTDIDREKHNELNDRLHSEVMGMLASAQEPHKIEAVFDKIIALLQQASPELAYAVLTTKSSYFSTNTRKDLPADFRAQAFPFDKHLQTGGTAIQAGEIVRVSIPESECCHRLAKFAADVGYKLCWIEILQSSDEEIGGALVAFKRDTKSAVLPDLDHIRHAARLIALAMQRKQIEEQLHLAASVYEVSSEAIVVTDSNKCVVAINPAFTDITGYTEEDVIGKSPEFFRTEGYIDTFFTVERLVSETGCWKGELWIRRKSGGTFPISAMVNTVNDESGNFFRRICVFSDITEIKDAQQRLLHLASHDALTGLPNRTLFLDRLQQALALAERENGLLGLMYIDLDHFKPINDSLGHVAGDHLLRAVAERMNKSVRESDTVARIGGDEFVVLLPAIKSAADAVSVSDKIRESLDKPFKIAGELVSISVSIGTAIYPEDGVTEHELALHADRAMYLEKQSRRTMRRD